jgi:hypothetical protein
MYRRGVRLTLGWTNAQALMPRVLCLMAEQRLDVSAIHTVASWDDMVPALGSPPAKLVFVRPEART